MRGGAAAAGRAVAFVLLSALALGVVACRPRVDVRVLSDARLESPLSELLALHEMRTGLRIRATYASDDRVEVLMETGRHDVVLVAATRLDARPVTSDVARDSLRVPWRDRAGTLFALAVRRHAGQAASAASLWRFLQEDEARAVFVAAGLEPARARHE